MPITILLLFLVQPLQQVEQQLQRQQQQLEQVRSDLRQQQQQLGQLLDAVERIRRDQHPVCSAELQVEDSQPARSVPGVLLNLFSTISRPDTCTPAEVRIAASYFTAEGQLICSGVVQNAAIQNALLQAISLEIRPWDPQQFVRWANAPSRPPTVRLACMDPEWLVEATGPDLDRAVLLRLRVTVLPRAGGIATTEFRFTR